ncbi:MAG: alginate lyase family protein [Gammaproteobacteria bacterium]
MQSLTWYANRLSRMSGAEIAHRLGKAARAAVTRVGAGNGATAAPPQLHANAPRFIAGSPRVDARCYTAAAQRVIEGEHRIFALDHCRLGHPPEWNRDPLTGQLAPARPAELLDYRDERVVGNIKYLWEPNRHLHFVTLAQAYALTGEQEFGLELERQIDSWWRQCPPGIGPNWASSLELGIRLINWSLTWQLLGGVRSPCFAGVPGQMLRRKWLELVYLHARAITRNLSRFSSANNHLIGEAAGVYIASVSWPYWPELQRWGQHCREILEAEALAQNAPDGGNREQAMSYQQFVLDFLLLAGLAGRAAGEHFAPRYWQRIDAMIDFLASMMDVAGHVPMIGDADDGYAVRLVPLDSFSPYRSLIATGALLFERPDLARKAGMLDDKTRWLMGPDADERFNALACEATQPYEPRRAFSETGLYLLGSSFETPNEIRLLVDAGPLGYLSIAAHGHADTLAIVLNVAGREVLIDPGTYAYHTEPEWRRYFRSTRAHNTVMIDDTDQSQQAGNFMWTEHARARCSEISLGPRLQRFSAEHDGYTRLEDPVTHRRVITYDEPSATFIVTDELLCAGRHRASRHWHFAESLEPRVGEDGTCTLHVGGYTVTLTPLEKPEEVQVFRGGSPEEGGWVSRSLGRKTPCTTVAWHSAIEGDTTRSTRIRCRREH